MKRRWAILFWTSLSALIGLSWMAGQFGAVLWSVLNVAMFGLILASAIAFAAMRRGTQAKWPAAAVLVCAAPMAIQMLRIGAYLGVLIDIYGASAILLIGGTLATAAVAVWILLRPLVEPPLPPPVAPARLLD